jgi:hypothetical protein
MKKLFNDEQIKFIVSNYQTMKYKDIAKSLGNYTEQQITGWLNNNGYKKGHNSMFSNEDMEYMRSNYKIITYKEIANNLGYTERQVRGWINNNCDKKLRKFNDDYFSIIDSPNKAYWLGFIFADGWIHKDIKNRNYELGIELQLSDIKQLNDFNNELGNAHDIVEKHSEKYICDYHKKSITDSVVLRVYSKKIVDDLIRHGVVENKTKSTIFPKINDYFFDFLRGYIDGDGCIYVNDKGYMVVHITSANPDVLQYIKNKLSKDYDIKSNIYQEKENKYRIYFNKINSIKLLDFIYYDDNVQKLNRKYEKYLLLK